MFRFYKVVGASMTPTLFHGDYVLCLTWPLFRFTESQVVVVNHHKYQTIIKRIKRVSGSRGYWLVGDNPQSTSSQELGFVTHENIAGLVLLKIINKRKVPSC
jgi:phage repressor protein C with HTH and peptisase S24 domain